MASVTLDSRIRVRPVLEEGRTCWRIAPAERVAFLVDGEAYFGAVAAALERARRRVWLLGWDFHTGMRLRRRDGESDLVDLLDGLVRARPRLDVYMLDWDFAMLFALDRQALPTLRFGTRTHPRLHFALDGNHPPFASHHQKLVVIDDAVAFTGGFDLTSCRWDTREHATQDERRSDPGFPRYEPFHDVGLVFDGRAARAVADLARERWRAATGQRMAPLRGALPGPCPWPSVAHDLEKVRLGLARTQPAWNGMPERREVEALYLESIRSAKRWLYIENQYLTAGSVRDALAARLREADGPEVVIVCPHGASGWLEERTMGVLRIRFVRELRQADRHGRLAVVYPVVPGSARVNVHSKVLVADDQLVRVGSSNLSNRSMGLDTELDVAIEALCEARVSRGIDAFRDDLLAEHLGRSSETVRATRERTGSLLATLDVLGGGERTLRPLDPEAAEWLDDWVPQEGVFDPERAVSFEELSARVLPSPPPEPEHTRRLLRLGAVALLLLALIALWRFTPLAESLRPDRLAQWVAPLRTAPWSPLLAILGITLGGALFVPITVLSVTSVLVYGPWLGGAVSLAGAIGSAALGWGIGRSLWRESLDRLLSPRLRRLSLRIAARGVLAVTTVRIVPVAPFAAINFAAGASHVRLRDLVLGTLLGMSPGVAFSALLTDRLARVVLEPGWVGALVLMALFALVSLAGRWVHGRSEHESEAC